MGSDERNLPGRSVWCDLVGAPTDAQPHRVLSGRYRAVLLGLVDRLVGHRFNSQFLEHLYGLPGPGTALYPLHRCELRRGELRPPELAVPRDPKCFLSGGFRGALLVRMGVGREQRDLREQRHVCALPRSDDPDGGSVGRAIASVPFRQYRHPHVGGAAVAESQRELQLPERHNVDSACNGGVVERMGRHRRPEE